MGVPNRPSRIVRLETVCCDGEAEDWNVSQICRWRLLSPLAVPRLK